MVASHSVAATEALSSATPTSTPSSPGPLYRDALFPFWTRCTQSLHGVIGASVTVCALHAVRFPKAYLATITILSMGLFAAGLFTNFELVLDLDQILTPNSF